FFFQAEDGIRDFHVTGVQTCALPIYCPPGGDHGMRDHSGVSARGGEDDQHNRPGRIAPGPIVLISCRADVFETAWVRFAVAPLCWSRGRDGSVTPTSLAQSHSVQYQTVRQIWPPVRETFSRRDCRGSPHQWPLPVGERGPPTRGALAIFPSSTARPGPRPARHGVPWAGRADPSWPAGLPPPAAWLGLHTPGPSPVLPLSRTGPGPPTGSRAERCGCYREPTA